MPTADPIRTLSRKDRDKMQVQVTGQVPHKFVDSLPCTYFVSVASAINAELFTYPLDLTKTRLQVQGEIAAATEGLSTAPHRGMVKTALGIVKEEGLFKLWQGILPAIYRHSIYSGIRIVIYEYLKENVLTKEKDGTFPLWKSAVNGCTAGAIGQFIASPADLVKVQIQMEGKRRLLGKPPRIKTANAAFAKIYKEGGIRGLWKGAVPNVNRAALVNLGDLSTYDYAKRAILNNTSLPDSHLCHFLSSVCAGFVASVMGTPADVIKTRIMNQPTDEKGNGLLYKNSLDCLTKTVKNEGLFALYKGFLPVWIRLAPWSLTFWMTFEQIRYVIGATSF
uniref:Mitochondrial uncoupling protein 4 n=1 Tax=Lygus hesperus TaxID=30085 RepID=A0A0A9WUH3_LYGHE